MKPKDVKNQAKKVSLKGKSLLSRLTGISCPVAGVSWTPPVDEQDIGKRLLTFLEDRRLLYEDFHWEYGPHVVDSVQKIRERLTHDLEGISKTSPLGESISAMRVACRKFLTVTQPRGHGARKCRSSDFGPQLMTVLGEFRGVMGIHVTRIACAYDLQIEDQLADMLPDEIDE
jgi:uncharacterized protein DUF6650